MLIIYILRACFFFSLLSIVFSQLFNFFNQQFVLEKKISECVIVLRVASMLALLIGILVNLIYFIEENQIEG